jgi:hypothetical protein
VVRLGAMTTARAAHQATLLRSGAVLVTGGCAAQGCGQIVASAELYDPRTRTFRAAAPMRTARASHTATLLPDGRVLVAGGTASSGGTATSEIYDPATNRWTPGPDMTAPRVSHIAVALRDGRVFVMGGGGGRLGDLRTAEVFDPRRGTFSAVGGMRTNHYLATRLADGRVLLTGGQDARGELLRTAELFDPARNVFLPTGDMVTPRVKHGAALLPDGRVLLMGGSDRRGYRARFASTEIYDPARGTFGPGPSLRWARHKLRDAVVTLAGGGVLVAGGAARPELWDPGSQAFLPVEGGLDGAQMFATATTLASGEVLVLGGYDEQIQPTRAVWIVRPRR